MSTYLAIAIDWDYDCFLHFETDSNDVDKVVHDLMEKLEELDMDCLTITRILLLKNGADCPSVEDIFEVEVSLESEEDDEDGEENS